MINNSLKPLSECHTLFPGWKNLKFSGISNFEGLTCEVMMKGLSIASHIVKTKTYLTQVGEQQKNSLSIAINLLPS